MIEKENSLTTQTKQFDQTRPTKSTTFVRHMLRYPLSTWSDTGYVNTYIDITDESMFIILDRFNNNKINFNSLVESLTYNHHFIDFVETDNFYIFKLHIPNEFKDDFYLFLDGDYSKTSEEYKQLILGLYYTYNKSIYQILNKTFYPKNSDIEELESRIGQKLYKKEITSSPTLKVETFNINNFR